MATKSDVWKHFTRLTDNNGKTIVDQAKCNSCHTVLKQESANGTSNLWRHFKRCHKHEDGGVGASRSPAPPTCNPSGPGASSKDSKPVMKKADLANGWLARMIADSGYDPAIVEDWNFLNFARRLNPKFKMPSRRVVDKICDGILDLSWGKIYKDGIGVNFSLSVGKANTMDRQVLYVARHYICNDGYYREKVLYAYEGADDEYCHGPLSVLPVASLELVADNIISEIPKGAGVFMMAFENKEDVTFVHDLKERIKQALGSRMGKQQPFSATYMDQVIHSIARCLLPDLDFRKRMYSAVSNLQLTRQGREDVLRAHELQDPWEHNELWYSCYCSLEVLRKGYSSTISVTDFQVIGILCDVWGKFYGAIRRISDPCYRPNSHLCLAELFKLREALQSQQESAIADRLRRAIAALDEAIQDSYLVWSVPLAMDPRYKLEYIEVLFETAFGSQAAGDYMAKVKGNIKDLYSSYDDGHYCAIDTNVGNSDRVQQAWNKRRRGHAKTYLDRYLQDTLVPEEEFERDFGDDIMAWWQSDDSSAYPKVARMALDALAMPTCSKLSSKQIAELKRTIRGYSWKMSVAEEEEREEHDSSDGNADAMIQDALYSEIPGVIAGQEEEEEDDGSDRNVRNVDAMIQELEFQRQAQHLF